MLLFESFIGNFFSNLFSKPVQLGGAAVAKIINSAMDGGIKWGIGDICHGCNHPIISETEYLLEDKSWHKECWLEWKKVGEQIKKFPPNLLATGQIQQSAPTVSKPGAVLEVRAVSIPPRIQAKMAAEIILARM